MANVTGVQGQDSEWQSNGAIAYGLFRFTFGLNLMMRGVVRIALGQAAFQGYMLKQFENVPVMPPSLLMTWLRPNPVAMRCSSVALGNRSPAIVPVGVGILPSGSRDSSRSMADSPCRRAFFRFSRLKSRTVRFHHNTTCLPKHLVPRSSRNPSRVGSSSGPQNDS